MKTNEIFLSNNSIAISLIRKYEYPYMILPKINEIIINIGKTLNDNYLHYEGNVWIHKTAKIDENVKIVGPCIIDSNAEIKYCAYLRENVIIGKNAVVGNSCEIKNTILFDEVKIPHFNYVGDSIIGYKSHIGAGSIISNLKSDKSYVVIKGKEEDQKTNLIKVGSFLGDNVEVGCNCVLNPGCIIGSNTSIYPLTSVRGVIDSDSIVKSMNNIIKKRDIEKV